MWAHLDKPNGLSNKYQIDICQLDKAAVKSLEAIGLEVKTGGTEKPQHGRFVTPKATVQVIVVDAIKEKWDVNKLLGNGTVVNCCIRAYDYDFKGKKGVGAGLQAIQVLNYVSYDPAAAFSVEEGFEKAKADDVPWSN